MHAFNHLRCKKRALTRCAKSLTVLAVGYQGAIEFDTSKPDGSPRKLMAVGLFNGMGWKVSIPMRSVLAVAYADFIASDPRA